MEAAEEKQQWFICPFCGNKRERGERAEKMYNRLIANGDAPEDAEKYVGGLAYLDCPTPELHEKRGLVPFEDLEHGAYYHGSCRNASIARWNAELRQFVYIREKFGYVYPEEIGYWIEAKPGEHRFDEFRPYGKVESPPFEIPMKAYMTKEEHQKRADGLMGKK